MKKSVISLMLVIFTASCVANIFCDPKSTTKKDQENGAKLWAAMCLAAYTSGQMAPTTISGPQYADPAVAAAAAQDNFVSCLLISGLFSPSNANPNFCP